MKISPLMALAVLALALPSRADERRSFCAQALDARGEPRWSYFQSRATAAGNRLSFYNQGGFFQAGVCWWHSMYTRNAGHIAVFRPSLPKPTYSRALDLIDEIRDRRHVVEIPGYKNLQDFSRDYAAEIRGTLERWQLHDTLSFGWLRGMRGRSEIDPNTLRGIMDKLYRQAEEEHKLVYQMLQFPGVEAHAWLVTGVQKLSNGYRLKVIDSNTATVDSWDYRFGSTVTGKYNGLNFVSYTQANGDFSTYRSRLRAYCL